MSDWVLFRFCRSILPFVMVLALVPSCKERGQVARFAFRQQELWEQEFDRLEEEARGSWQWLENQGSQRKIRSASRFMADSNAVVWPTDRSAVGVVYRRTCALVDYLEKMPGAPDLKREKQELSRMKRQIDRLARSEYSAPSTEEIRFFFQLKELNRKISLRNPLLDFDEILFSSGEERHPGIIQANDLYNPASGGGLYVVKGLKSGRLKYRNVLEGTLSDNPFRAILDPDLSYDGKRIVFSYVDLADTVGFDHVYNAAPVPSHLYCVNVDGSGLRQLTDSRWKDYSPCWMPDGRIVFLSERRGLSNRCSGLYDYEPVATLFSMKPDGTDIYPISFNEVNEMYPSVDNQGRLVYTRWDYVDRDFNAAHHIWTSYPDGRDPRAPHGNYPYPHETLDLTGKADDGRNDRPWSELFIRAVPGEESLYSAIASGHHTRAEGPLITIDVSIPDDNRMSQVRVITGNGKLPRDRELRNGQEPVYTSPWPLGKDFFLAPEGGTNNVFLLDKFGNRTLLFSAPTDLPVHDPIPVKPRPVPPVIPCETFQGERSDDPGHHPAVISMMNVYDSDFEWPEGVRIKALRIIEIFPRPMSLPDRHDPKVGYGSSPNARMVLGTVPVEEDGSAYFEAPVGRAIYFQALDAEGRAVQSMRSATYVHAGEHLSCMGCHEDKWKTSALPQAAKALQRKPSPITPEAEGSRPFSYARLAKPVLQEKCIRCHIQSGVDAPTSAEYKDLKRYAFFFHAQGRGKGLLPKHGGYRTIAGRFGARESRMGKALFSERHERYMKEGWFSREDRHRIVLWLDCNSNELGTYADAERQRSGDVVWDPSVDPDNPTGVESLDPRR